MQKTMTKALGDYGEHQLAPKLLKRIGLQQLVDLNKPKQNFPWADFCGKKEGRWWMVNVKTRVKHEKPDRFGKIKVNSSYNTSKQACKNYHKAIEKLKEEYFVDCKAMWLAIALDVDQTFEAYWGEAKEVRNFMKENISWGIPMGDKSTEKYRIENRMVAYKEPHDFDWTRYPDNWTYEAHLNWLNNEGLEK